MGAEISYLCPIADGLMTKIEVVYDLNRIVNKYTVIEIHSSEISES